VVAPDLPGYNTSDKPPRVRDYRPRLLAQNVADLIVALGAGSAAVAGHDWGGGLAWLLAMQHPERIQRLLILNAPPSTPLPQGPAQPPAAAAQLVDLGFGARERNFRAVEAAPMLDSSRHADAGNRAAGPLVDCLDAVVCSALV
jgi:pimeloyl-ACP methyl ester carboxylesterase